MRAVSVLFCAGLLSLSSLATAQKTDPLPPPASAVTVVKPERGFVDDAFALSADGSTLFYINTDGASYATLRAIGLPPRPGGAAPAPAQAPAPATKAEAPVPELRLAGGGSKKGPIPNPGKAFPMPAPAAPPAPAITLAPGASADVITGLPLSIIRVVMLPDDRVLMVTRDLDTAGVVNGLVYSLRSKTQIQIPGGNEGAIGPATDIVVGDSATGPVIVAATRPDGKSSEYTIKVYSAATAKLIGQRSYKVREGDGRIQSAQGSGVFLYFADDYQTIVAKHDGAYDKKKDIRQPDFLAFIDTLTGKLRRQQTISDPSGLLELTRMHKDHSESIFPHVDAETQKIELFAISDRAAEGSAAETRTELRLPRASNQYEGASLRYQKLRRDRILMSLTVDPVNEQAVAQRRSDPDDIDFCVLDPSAPGSLRKLKTIPGHKRPSAWHASSNGRLALLRKYKNFPRGGTEVEVYDLDVDGGSP